MAGAATLSCRLRSVVSLSQQANANDNRDQMIDEKGVGVACSDPPVDFLGLLVALGGPPSLAATLQQELGISDMESLRANASSALRRQRLLAAARRRLAPEACTALCRALAACASVEEEPPPASPPVLADVLQALVITLKSLGRELLSAAQRFGALEAGLQATGEPASTYITAEGDEYHASGEYDGPLAFEGVISASGEAAMESAYEREVADSFGEIASGLDGNAMYIGASDGSIAPTESKALGHLPTSCNAEQNDSNQPNTWQAVNVKAEPGDQECGGVSDNCRCNIKSEVRPTGFLQDTTSSPRSLHIDSSLSFFPFVAPGQPPCSTDSGRTRPFCNSRRRPTSERHEWPAHDVARMEGQGQPRGSASEANTKLISETHGYGGSEQENLWGEELGTHANWDTAGNGGEGGGGGECTSVELPHVGESHGMADTVQELVPAPAMYKPFFCDDCGQGFTQQSNLRVHRRTHTGERPFRCPDCGRGFSLAYNMLRHRRTHTGEKPFGCATCGLTFRLKHHLLRHAKKHSSNATPNVSNLPPPLT
uniref:C2H2-type domain-containing protein n=1 Tax=Eptatretus burgeri TaxID=7764 RepID=A0A8C4QTC6_EPTBU